MRLHGPRGLPGDGMRVNDQPSVLWTLRDRGGTEVRCEARLLPVGIEGRIVWNGSELYAFRFSNNRELRTWGNEKRAELQSQG